MGLCCRQEPSYTTLAANPMVRPPGALHSWAPAQRGGVAATRGAAAPGRVGLAPMSHSFVMETKLAPGDWITQGSGAPHAWLGPWLRKSALAWHAGVGKPTHLLGQYNQCTQLANEVSAFQQLVQPNILMPIPTNLQIPSKSNKHVVGLRKREQACGL